MCLPEELRGATIQSIVAAVGNLLCINFGMMFGIMPPHALLYQSPNTPLNRIVSADETDAMPGLFFLSAATGALLLGPCSYKIGPKSVLLLCGLLQIGSWSCIHFADDIMHIYGSRVFGGMAGGAIFTVLPIYITEISEPSNSGRLIISIEQSRTLGILLGFAMGYYVPYPYVSIAALCVSFTFTLVFPFSQESPHYFLRKDNIAGLEKSLRWYRGIRQMKDRNKPEFLQELSEFKNNKPNEMFSYNGSRGYLGRVFVAITVLVVGAQLSGTYLLFQYAQLMFNWHESYPLAIDTNVLILAAVQFLGASVTGLMWPNFKRQLTLVLSAFMAFLSLVLLMASMLFDINLGSPQVTAWIPLIALSIYIFVVNMGMYPLATLIMSEMLSQLHHVVFSSITWTLSWVLLFIFVQYFLTTHLVVCVGVFAGSCFIMALGALILVPETYGKTPLEIKLRMGLKLDANVAKSIAATEGRMRPQTERV